VEELRGYDFNYWALGHIHKPAVLSSTAPFVVYAGTPQGLNPKETGLHGFYHVNVEADRSATLQFVPACQVVWSIETLDAAFWETPDDAIAALENRLPDAVKVEVAFKKPIFLPGKAQFGAEETPTGWRFALVNPSSGAPHLLGRTTAL